MPTPKTITVTVTEAGPGSSPVIAVSEEPVELDDTVHGHGNGALVHWEIATEGWTFTNDGILVDDLGRRAFRNKGQRADKKRHTWQRDDADRQTYKYSIGVTKDKVTVVWDPTIRNF
jgi:hypothetical protein